ncbi:MAG: formylglycine-generating enzyme family protein [Lachnotalea sp.]
MRNSLKRFKIANLLFIFILIGLIGIFSLGFIKSIHKTSAINVASKELSIVLGDGITMEFVCIDSGSFLMGSYEEEGDSDETPRHKVTITKPFYIGKYEVTQEQWEKVMGNNPSELKGEKNPVDTVSWNDCIEFTEELKTITGREFTLPTEAQWEYACRAGTTTKWFFGDDENNADLYGWIDSNSQKTTHPVGMLQPNAWGLYDMYGNLSEWCKDWYQNSYLETEAVDPAGPEVGDSHVVRGGGWGEFPDNARSSYRNANGENGENNGTGFRCVMYLE